MPVDPREISFTFQADGTYQYRSTLDYQEAGRYRLQPPYLFTTDTTRETGTEKAVEMLVLQSDTLLLRMVQDGKEQRLLLLHSDGD